jgi:hypothetical protein
MSGQRGRRARFLQEAGDDGFLKAEVIGEDFDREQAAGRAVPHKVHLCHSTAANPSQDLVFLPKRRL